MREHVSEQGVAGNVEGHAEAHVAGALVQLAVEMAFFCWGRGRCGIGLFCLLLFLSFGTRPAGVTRVGDVELGKHVAWRQHHARHVGRVPSAQHQPPIERVRPQGVHDPRQLVHALAYVVCFRVDVFRAEMPPLEAVHGAEIADLALREAEVVEELARAVAVPDLDALRGESVRGGVAGDEPEELGDDGFGEDAFCGQEREDGRARAVEGEFEGSWGEDGVGPCAGSAGSLR